MLSLSKKLLTLVALCLLTLVAAAPAVAQTCSEETAAIFAAMEAVAELNVPVEGALLVELASAMTGLATGDVDGVVADLESFISKVEAQSGKQIDATAAVELIAFAQGVMDTALCPCGEGFARFPEAFATLAEFYASYSPFFYGYDASPEGTEALLLLIASAGTTGGLAVLSQTTGFFCVSGDPNFNSVPVEIIDFEDPAQAEACANLIAGVAAEVDCTVIGVPCPLP